jgi:hypothetical protein
MLITELAAETLLVLVLPRNAPAFYLPSDHSLGLGRVI